MEESTKILVSEDNIAVGKLYNGVLFRLFHTVLFGRHPVEVNLINGNINPVPKTVLRRLPFEIIN